MNEYLNDEYFDKTFLHTQNIFIFSYILYLLIKQ